MPSMDTFYASKHWEFPLSPREEGSRKLRVFQGAAFYLWDSSNGSDNPHGNLGQMQC